MPTEQATSGTEAHRPPQSDSRLAEGPGINRARSEGVADIIDDRGLRDLLRRANGGDKRAWDEFGCWLWRFVDGYIARKYQRYGHDAEDMVEGVIEGLFTSKALVLAPAARSFTSFISVCVHHQCVDFLTREGVTGRHGAVSDPGTTPYPDPVANSGHSLAQLVRREIWAIVERVCTPRQAQALRLCYVEGLRAKEIAEKLGTTEGNVYKLLHDTRRVLRVVLLEQYGGEAAIWELLRTIASSVAAPLVNPSAEHQAKLIMEETISTALDEPVAGIARLYFNDERSIEEIARQCECAEDLVRGMMEVAHQGLRALLQQRDRLRIDLGAHLKRCPTSYRSLVCGFFPSLFIEP